MATIDTRAPTALATFALGSPLRLAAATSSTFEVSATPPLVLPRFATGHPRRRFWLAVKVGVAATIASLGTLVDAFDDATGGFAVWAVVTVLIVMQPTLGSTLSKGVNRLVGTVSAAGVAACAGFGARSMLPTPLSSTPRAGDSCSTWTGTT